MDGTTSATPSHATSRWHTRSCTRRGSPTTPCSNPYVARGGGVRGQRAVGLWSRRRARLHASQRRSHHQTTPRSLPRHLGVKTPRRVTACVHVPFHTHVTRISMAADARGAVFTSVSTTARRHGKTREKWDVGAPTELSVPYQVICSGDGVRQRGLQRGGSSFTSVLPQPMTDGLFPAGTTLCIDATASP